MNQPAGGLKVRALDFLDSTIERPPALVPKPSLAVGFSLALLFFLITATPGVDRPFSSHGEAREGVVARNMIEQSNLVLPLRNGREIPSKPPLFHWLAVGAGSAVGELSEFALRLPSAVAGALLLFLLYTAVGSIFSPREGLVAALLLGTSFEWFRAMSGARVDMVFACALNFSLIAGFTAFHRLVNGRPWASFSIAAGLSAGLATLAKGPAGVILPGTALLLFGVFERRQVPRGKLRLYLLGTGLASLIGASVAGVWYFAAYLEGGRRFLEVLLLKENVARMAHLSGYGVGHQKPFYYSVYHLFLGFLPWSLLLPALLARPAKLGEDQRTAVHLLILWSALLFVAVTVSSSKRPVYLIPAYPAISVLLSVALTRSQLHRAALPIYRCGLSAVGAILALTSALALITLMVGQDLALWCSGTEAQGRLCAAVVSETGRLSAVASLGLVTAGLLLMGVWTSRGGGKYVFAGILLFYATVALAVQPTIARVTSPRDFMREVTAVIPSGEPLYSLREEMYSAIFYASGPIVTVKNIREMELPGYLLLRSAYFPELSRVCPKSVIVRQSPLPAVDGKDFLVLAKVER